ncbi:MarR family transcriptional regulator [Cryobacterium sp. PH29-G1]|uniref:MarR family winged helix-turn-helix transcriptional regulator n=1 Tax=Cryobacterium sp. PH29-G1 TaxID=3046211 RepID=UPI0024B880A4|nr:MarR family transcriptional regulator [Cryobacterium sp. PH29-G1]MDJ0348833.1 MarR family transcriptional regulator [Cryobacterium sp. PH29-G1]
MESRTPPNSPARGVTTTPAAATPAAATPGAPNVVEADTAELSHEFRLANGRLARRLRQQKADNELGSGQFSALGVLYLHGPLTLTELSDFERVTPPSMTRTVKCLVDAGLVSRTDSALDGRKVVLSTTDAAAAIMQETRKRRDAWLVHRVAQLSPEQHRILAAATLIMKELADS